MTIKHFVKLVKPRFMWFINSKKRLFREWRRFKKVREIRAKGKELYKLWFEKRRKNTTSSLKEAYGINKQIEILKWVLGEE